MLKTDENKALIQERIKDLQENTDILSTLLESISGYSIIVWDFDGNITAFNEGARQIFGYKPAAVIGKQVVEIFFPKEFIDNGKFQHMVNEIIKNGTYYYEDDRLRENGEIFPAQVLCSLTKDKNNNVIGFIEMLQDVTERKYLEKQLQNNMSNYIKLVNDSADGIIIINPQGIVLLVNPAAKTIFGEKMKNIVGQELGIPIASAGITELDIMKNKDMHSTVEMRVTNTIWNNQEAYLISIHDVTELKQAFFDQEKLTQQMRSKVNELEAFSYGIAHDLRSPLISVEGFTGWLKEDMLNHNSEKVQEDMRLIESGVRKMRNFLNDTLEYSRSGQTIKRTQKVDFFKIIKEVVKEFEDQVKTISAGISVANQFPRIYADPTRIKQVLTNLIQNSIKYRDQAVPLQIEIGHRLSKGEIIFFVRDNGRGIATEEIEKVFELFYRGVSDVEGSGIGLAIVKKIIEAHGGRIWVQPNPSEKGTTICFTLAEQNDIQKGDKNGKD
jgi:two-component system, LuxR family, sensor kinase FixL